MTLTNARVIAARLGLPQEVVRAVQRHGFLRQLDLGEREIRERLWRAHLAHISAAATLSGKPKRAREDR